MASKPQHTTFEPGKYVVCAKSYKPGKEFTKGKIYKVELVYTSVLLITADDSKKINGWHIKHFYPIDIDSLSALERAFYDIPRKPKK